jgi:UDP-glucose 4-epimerase
MVHHMFSLERTVKGKNVLVTGGAGFIGSHLVDLLITEGIRQLTIIDNFYQGKAANLTEARCHMPNLRVLHMDTSDDREVLKARSGRCRIRPGIVPFAYFY